MRKNAKPLLETIGDAVVEAQRPRVYGLYSYESYPGDAPPYVVRHEPTGAEVERFDTPGPARELFERLEREHVAKEVLAAFMTWMQNDLCERATRAGLR